MKCMYMKEARVGADNHGDSLEVSNVVDDIGRA